MKEKRPRRTNRERKYKYVVDTYDAMELMPWIRTFTGRIERVESDNPELGKNSVQIWKNVCDVSGGDDDAVVS